MAGRKHQYFAKVDGVLMSATQIAARLGMDADSIRDRMHNGETGAMLLRPPIPRAPRKPRAPVATACEAQPPEPLSPRHLSAPNIDPLVRSWRAAVCPWAAA